LFDIILFAFGTIFVVFSGFFCSGISFFVSVVFIFVVDFFCLSIVGGLLGFGWDPP